MLVGPPTRVHRFNAGCGASTLVKMEIEATGLPEMSKGRITEEGFEPAALREETSLFPGANVIGG